MSAALAGWLPEPESSPEPAIRTQTASSESGSARNASSSADARSGPFGGPSAAGAIDLIDSEPDDVPLAMQSGNFRPSQPTPSTSALDRTAAKALSSRPSPVARRRGANDFLKVPLAHFAVTIDRGTTQHPHMIRFKKGVTDASRDRWPSEEIDPKDGQHFVRNVVDSDDPLRSRYWADWLCKLGFSLAKQLNLDNWDSEYYVLEDFPEDYALFDLVGPGKAKDGATRHDAHLRGSLSSAKSFTSPNEFVMHAVWLIKNGPGVPYTKCRCQSCTGRGQIEVNIENDIDTHYGGRSYAVGVITKPKRRIFKKKKRSLSKAEERIQAFLGPRTEKDRVRDRVYHPLARRGELVWAELERALEHENNKFVISHWPAIVLDRHVHRNAHALERDLSAKDALRHVYSVQLLALETKLELEEWEIRPWLGFPVLPYNREEVKDPSAVGLVYEGGQIVLPALSHFNRQSSPATTAYAHALHIATGVDRRFSVVDIRRPTALDPLSSDVDVDVDVVEFSSVWWGAELVHCKELVRILSHDKLFADELTNRLPSRASQGHSLFFWVESFQRTPHQEGFPHRVKMAGVLVELVRVDGDDMEQDSVDALSVEQSDLPLPHAPKGCKFQVLTHRDKEVILDLEYLAGRYYPLPEYLADYPDRIEQTQDNFDREKKRKARFLADDEDWDRKHECPPTEDQLALILAGLYTAKHRFTKATHWSPDRHATLIDAEKIALDEMVDFLGTEVITID